MGDTLIIISIVLSVITLLLVAFLFFKRVKGGTSDGEDILRQNKQISENLQKNMQSGFDSQVGIYKNFNEMLTSFLSTQLKTQIEQLKDIELRVNEILKTNDQKLEKVKDIIDGNLKELTQNNEKKLEEMRVTVDEKLTSTLEKRLGDSVKIINERLESVSKNLGEMQNIAQGMGDLTRVLTNVKTRGGWGEVQLETLLEQVLSKAQYSKQVMIKKNSTERVDFVINMPGKNDDTVFLPIDAKFPLEDYSRLCAASERGDIKEVEIQAKNLERRIKEEGKKIKEKYIDIPKTTDFAIMYLPVEGLYAEVAKNPGLCDTLQREHRVMVCGPNTFAALLNSLQMGFKTLAIEKRSSEVWKMLATFKQEFSKFVELLSKTQKKLDEASNTIEFATKKTKTIQNKLKTVADLETPSLDLAKEEFEDGTDNDDINE